MTGRNIVVAIDLSDTSYLAARWAVQEFWKAGDIIHLVHVARFFTPQTSIQHSFAGATYDVPAPTASLDQNALSDGLKEAIRAKYTDEMDKAGVIHCLHLYLDTDNAPASAICRIVEKVADECSGCLIVMAGHTQPAKAIDNLRLGSVPDYFMTHSKRPLVVVRDYPRPVDMHDANMT